MFANESSDLIISKGIKGITFPVKMHNAEELSEKLLKLANEELA